MSATLVLLRTQECVISPCTIYLDATRQTLTWEGGDLGNVVFIAAMYLRNQSI